MLWTHRCPIGLVFTFLRLSIFLNSTIILTRKKKKTYTRIFSLFSSNERSHAEAKTCTWQPINILSFFSVRNKKCPDLFFANLETTKKTTFFCALYGFIWEERALNIQKQYMLEVQNFGCAMGKTFAFLSF